MGLSNSITCLERFPGLNVRSRAVPPNSNEAECVRPPENFLRSHDLFDGSIAPPGLCLFGAFCFASPCLNL